MNTALNVTPQLLALDWGTSSLRAFLMAQGNVIESRQSGHGIQHLPLPGTPGYEKAFAEMAGDWLSRWPELPVVASGMVGSAQGWKEAPYVRCPANIHTLAECSIPVATGLGPELLIAPGVLYDEPGELPDVMRGEEIQIAGALLMNPQWAARSCMLLPGTHSKWAYIENGKIVRFTTYLTGELFAVLCKHSILGRLMPADSDRRAQPEAAAFAMGLATARAGGSDLSHQIFGARTLGLTGRVPPEGLAGYLSGLLIGHELAAGLASAGDLSSTPLIVIGAPELCERYTRSLQAMGKVADAVLENTAPVGLWSLAQAAGLLGAA